SADPRLNPWEQPELRELRTNYHEALLDYLSDPMKPKRLATIRLRLRTFGVRDRGTRWTLPKTVSPMR
ncbi:MAG: hypothetical protein RID07_04275, partial [Lacipirellulaceae bacterium]